MQCTGQALAEFDRCVADCDNYACQSDEFSGAYNNGIGCKVLVPLADVGESLLPAEEFLSVRGVHRHCRRFQQPPNLPHDASQSCTHCVSADCYTSFAGGPQGASSAGGMAVVDSLEVLAELAGGECPVFLDRAPVVGHLHPPNYSPNTTTCLCASINVAN